MRRCASSFPASRAGRNQPAAISSGSVRSADSSTSRSVAAARRGNRVPARAPSARPIGGVTGHRTAAFLSHTTSVPDPRGHCAPQTRVRAMKDGTDRHARSGARERGVCWSASPHLAAQQATEILKVVPDHPRTLIFRARARSDRRGDRDSCAAPSSVGPDDPEAHALADHLHAIGRCRRRRRRLRAPCVRNSTRKLCLQRGQVVAMLRNDLATAESLLKSHLMRAPTDVPAIRMLAEVAVRCGRDEDAMHLSERCLSCAPTRARTLRASRSSCTGATTPERALAGGRAACSPRDRRDPAYRDPAR